MDQRYNCEYQQALEYAKEMKQSPGAEAVIRVLDARIEILKERAITEDNERKAASHAAIREIRNALEAIRSTHDYSDRVVQRY